MSNLKTFLNQLLDEFHQAQFLNSDPLEYVHHFQDPWDQEAVALLSAVLAYGNVKQIRKSIQTALIKIQKLAPSPKEFVISLERPSFQKKAHTVFQDYVHRFNSGADLVCLFILLSQSWSKYGSLGAHFLEGLDPKDKDISIALSRLIAGWRQNPIHDYSSTFSYLLTSPEDGSCCKRWCMFLRWMGRKDQLDPGLWTSRSPLLQGNGGSNRGLESKQLVMPLDTHTGRISQYLGLTQRKSLNWKAAIEVTQALKKVDPNDPTRYDFALSRLGILDICQRSYREEICKKCQLLPECQFAKNQSKASTRSKGRSREASPCH